ncbi:hypothetical protein AGLY_000008 [Aphis glycines]|uniref:Uncharacterized protein n=1 Tax=Aphis glycines TaxID=307491 RepID=A0A6G0U689_APHGL|nr:hypothetical protein AGLY_000008 [Aphis glycines]
MPRGCRNFAVFTLYEMLVHTSVFSYIPRPNIPSIVGFLQIGYLLFQILFFSVEKNKQTREVIFSVTPNYKDLLYIEFKDNFRDYFGRKIVRLLDRTRHVVGIASISYFLYNIYTNSSYFHCALSLSYIHFKIISGINSNNPELFLLNANLGSEVVEYLCAVKFIIRITVINMLSIPLFDENSHGKSINLQMILVVMVGLRISKQ